MNAIPCIQWIKRGKSKKRPDKLQIQEEDLKRIIEQTQEKLEEEEEASSEEEENNGPIDDGTSTTQEDESKVPISMEVQQAIQTAAMLKKVQKKPKKKSQTVKSGVGEDFDSRYNMDDYDDEQEDSFGLNPLRGIGNLTVFANNQEDPYVTLKNDESDDEDSVIKDTDNLLLVAKAEGDCCSMEVHIYNSELGNLYCHHDILLSSFPLAVEWMDYDLRDASQGTFVAISSMDPTIDIWDIDLMDSLEPLATLGCKPKKKKKKKLDIPSHRDAVLDLSWNKLARHILASASADFTVGLWDLTEGKLAQQINQHTEKVQCVEWHPAEEHLLLSGSFDKTVKLYDCRSMDMTSTTWNLNGEIEKILWNPFSPNNFYASTDNGNVYYMDYRQEKPVYTLAAHSESVTGLNLSKEDARLLITTSSDKTVKIWDVGNDEPSLVHTKNMNIGQLFCLDSSPDSPYVFAIGGEKKFNVWDVREVKDVFTHFCGTEEEYIADHRPDEDDDDDNEGAMEIQEMQAATSIKKKKRKKNKQNKHKRFQD